MLTCPDRLALRIATAPWSRLPAPIWALTACPALTWAGIGDRWIGWPKGCAKSPLRASFWHVAAGE